MSTTESLEERIRNLKAFNERIDSVHSIANLVNKKEFLLRGGLYKEVVDLFAQKTPGVRAELGNLGMYEGTEGIKRLFGPKGLHEWMQGNRETGMIPGVLVAQGNMTPIIEVAGDGKTAKGLWNTLGPSTVLVKGKPEAHWMMTKRAYDFVKEDGEWKIWHYHEYFILYCTYYTSWVDQEKVPVIDELPSQVPANLKPDKPTTYYWIYASTRPIEYVPQIPEPYETFDKTFSY